MASKTRFPFATVEIVNGAPTIIVRRHTSPVNAKRYAEGRNAESKAAGTGKEYGIIVRTTEKRGTFDPSIDYVPETVGVETSSARPSRRGGSVKDRFPVISVEMTKDGNVKAVAKRHTSPKNAFHYATGRNAESAGDKEFAVVLRTSTKDGSLPVITDAE